jgi:superfamily I DNA and/or RNA helicase
LEYDLCIIDEVSKATPTEALIPMSRARRWVLVGDRRQLPPFLETALAEPETLARYRLTQESLRETLLDRISDEIPSECHFVLTQQHRMCPAIGDLISECFYEGELSSVEKHVPDYILRTFGSSVLWLSTSNCEGRGESKTVGSTSRSNELEANEIRLLLMNLAFYAQEKRVSAAILTGYADQRDLLRKVLNAASGSLRNVDYEVATVDAFQGREADVCMFSLVRSNVGGDLGFLSSRQRINVALSRGRLGLAVVGDADFIETSPAATNPLRDVLSYIRSHNATCAFREACE